MDKSHVLKTAEKVINRLISPVSDDNDHMDINLWEWPQGVAMYGLYKFYTYTGENKYLQYMINWYDEQIEKGLPIRNINTTAPLLTLAHIYEITGEEKYLEICKNWAHWVYNDLPRTEEGGFQHVTTHLENKEQLWADTLFMTVLFLGKMGKLLDNKDYIEEAIHQALIHIKYMYDKKTSLWYHGWSFDGRHNFGEVFWARGNCWFTAGAVELIDILELEGANKDYILNTLRAQIKELDRHQDESGLWHTIINDPTTYLEASATAGFSYGILRALQLGYIDNRYNEIVNRALKGLLDCVDEDGIVNQVSYGTAIGMNDQHYKEIEICPTAYGQGLLFLFLVEVVNSLKGE
ncbi:beta-galactosidase BglB [Vallitalea okinawensis]|uniref:beta-galactosidase BglB n=1 Tax=Vallitalea okinawensis TaxID=2078660 RepID=UPI001FA89D1E|nr:glycoside hydrolase family 88 protein [Vallitalea okinawensis]